MKKDKPIEIEVKTVFTGGKSAEQAFVDLIRLRNGAMTAFGVELIPKQMYNGGNVVFLDGHSTPERGHAHD